MIAVVAVIAIVDHQTVVAMVIVAVMGIAVAIVAATTTTAIVVVAITTTAVAVVVLDSAARWVPAAITETPGVRVVTVVATINAHQSVAGKNNPHYTFIFIRRLSPKVASDI